MATNNMPDIELAPSIDAIFADAGSKLNALSRPLLGSPFACKIGTDAQGNRVEERQPLALRARKLGVAIAIRNQSAIPEDMMEFAVKIREHVLAIPEDKVVKYQLDLTIAIATLEAAKNMAATFRKLPEAQRDAQILREKATIKTEEIKAAVAEKFGAVGAVARGVWEGLGFKMPDLSKLKGDVNTLGSSRIVIVDDDQSNKGA